MPQTIRNPIEWTGEQIVNAGHAIASAHRTLDHMADTAHSPIPAVRKITIADVRESLAKGFDDFQAYRSDVLFVGIIYAAVGLVLARAVFGSDMLPLLFPLASGFAIIGPFAAIGLYEMSRRREQGAEVTWANAFDVFKAPAVGGIMALGVMLVMLFLVWLAAAWGIYALTLGPAEPVSISAFAPALTYSRPAAIASPRPGGRMPGITGSLPAPASSAVSMMRRRSCGFSAMYSPLPPSGTMPSAPAAIRLAMCCLSGAGVKRPSASRGVGTAVRIPA